MTDTPFHQLDDYLDLPRLSGLRLSPDGERLVTSVSTPDPERTRYLSALWEIDPTGTGPARRLTRGAKGERAPAFTPDGDLLFVSARPDPERAPAAPAKDEPPAALWLLPKGGGEARVVGTRPGGVDAPSVAAASGTVLVTSATLPGAVTGEDDERRRTARREKKISAVLHDGYPVRYWDHHLGPDQTRLLAAEPPAEGRIDWIDLTPTPGQALRETHAELSPDGTVAVADWQVAEPRGTSRSTVVAIDVRTDGARRPLLDDPDHEFYSARISPDGRTVAALRERRATPTTPPEIDLVLVPLAGGSPRVLTEGWDRWPTDARWTPDSEALIVAADQDGRAPLFRLPSDGTGITQLTADDAAYTDPCVSPDGRHVYALRSAVDSPPAPVKLDARTPDQHPSPLQAPTPRPALPGELREVTARAEDGTALRAWLAVPSGADQEPAPMLLWIHGGPLTSWNAWHWRWNPWLLVAQGYAVLLPDPALSTGYGQAFIERGWARWGKSPYTDLLALTDAAEARPDIDHTRTAAMGGSFGGYMANWIAGHTDRFAAIVTHASLWAMDQFGRTTDSAHYWAAEMTDEMAAANTPHTHADRIRTPMLVIHGDKDYRVPIGEALRLWWDLQSRQDDPATQPHRFLYFPDENHWVLAPQHAALWYRTVIAFLAHHVLGKELEVPDLLR
ncbi:S9 family peptidase [Pseudonocardia acaciae]|uniref:S9 family peptidase n=1 Tax=Pseudonocardia acaciae TaxID=551276 RepID=UPI00048F4CC2|nr:prolyl oligopeptidase family serine peptidase [Pseudonocardia acaciae]